VIPEKRKLMVAGAAIAAAFALPGCAPAGYNQSADYGNAAAPAAQPNATASATGGPESTASPSSTSAAAANDGSEVPKLTDAQVTHKLTATKVSKMGEVIENDQGHVLYRFDDDSNNPPKATCDGDCDKVWKPALTIDGKPTLKGVDSKVVSTVTRSDGTKQLTVKGWPLYAYLGDKKVGTWKGQNVNGKWFVIKPDGAKNLTCVPAVSKPVAPPKGDSSGDGGDSGSDYSY
jgi:predicted lipoprotein with Yx(FWY)xxD motif